jgi:hypothetical protein
VEMPEIIGLAKAKPLMKIKNVVRKIFLISKIQLCKGFEA